jgi:enoyl-CoA hydratase
MPEVNVDYVSDGRFAIVTLNRPDRLNAVTYPMLELLFSTFEDISRNLNCRVVIVTGAGRGFCAGHDTKEHGDLPDWLQADLGRAQSGMLQQKYWATMVPRMRAMPQPVIAAVNGPVAGGGYPLVVGADIRVASESAVFVDAFINIGLSGCEMGLGWLLPRLVGMSRAAELLLTGRRLDAAEAERIGLVLRVVPDGQVVDAAIEIAERIAANTPLGVWMTKATMWSCLETPSLEAAIDLEARTQILGTMTQDFVEQMQSSREKRPPKYGNQ